MEAISAAFRGEFDAVQKFVPTISAATVEQEATPSPVAAALADENIALRKRLTKIHVMVLEGILAELETEDFGMTEALRPELERLYELIRTRAGRSK